MISRIRKNSQYGLFDLFTEADDAPKRNVKTVDVKPNNRSKDFAAVADDSVEEDPPEGNAEDNNPDTGDENGNNEDYADGSDESVRDDTQSDTEDQATVDTEEDPDTGDENGNNEDYADGSDETVQDNENNGEQQPDNTDKNDTSTEDVDIDLDSERKYKLYKEYMLLYNTIDGFISKLENTIKDDYAENSVYKKCTKQLRNLKTMVFDYMTIMYPNNSYVQSILFYQQSIAVCQLVIGSIEK